MSKTKRIAITGLFAALAVGLSYVEYLIPVTFIPLPGFKLGIANLAIMAALYFFGPVEAAAVSALRLLLTFFLFSNVSSFLYSAAGALLSLSAMILIRRTDRFSEIGVSVSGAVFHNAGQITVASALLRGSGVWYYFPALLLAGTVTGLINGIILRLLSSPIKRLVKESNA